MSTHATMHMQIILMGHKPHYLVSFKFKQVNIHYHQAPILLTVKPVYSAGPAWLKCSAYHYYL